MSAAALRIGMLLGLPWNQPGGVQRVARGLALEFERHGHRVSILALGPPGAGDREQTHAGSHLRLLQAPGAAESWEALNRRLDLEQDVLGWCADRELDLVHLQHFAGLSLGLPERLRDLGQRVFVSLHDDGLVCPRGQMWSVDGVACESVVPATCADCWSRTWPKLGTRQAALGAVEDRLLLARQALAACTRVFVPSNSAREMALAWGAPESRIELLPNGSDGVVLAHGPRSFDPADVRVAVLGSVQPSKGVLFLARLMVELGAPFHLDLHGALDDYHGDRSHLDQLESLAAESGRVTLHGAYAPERLPEILGQLDLVCVPSLWHEVHGLVAREALLAGLPVFVAARGGLQELPCLQLPAGDADAWAGALKRFATDEPWRLAQAVKGLEIHNVEQSALAHLRAYNAAL